MEYEAKEEEYGKAVHNNQINLECVFHKLEDLELQQYNQTIVKQQTKVVVDNYRSKNMNSNSNHKVLSLVKNIIRYLSGKQKKQLSGINLDLYIDSAGKIWVLGVSEMKFFSSQGDIEMLDKNEVIEDQRL